MVVPRDIRSGDTACPGALGRSANIVIHPEEYYCRSGGRHHAYHAAASSSVELFSWFVARCISRDTVIGRTSGAGPSSARSRRQRVGTAPPAWERTKNKCGNPYVIEIIGHYRSVNGELSQQEFERDKGGSVSVDAGHP